MTCSGTQRGRGFDRQYADFRRHPRFRLHKAQGDAHVRSEAREETFFAPFSNLQRSERHLGRGVQGGTARLLQRRPQKVPSLHSMTSSPECRGAPQKDIEQGTAIPALQYPHSNMAYCLTTNRLPASPSRPEPTPKCPREETKDLAICACAAEGVLVCTCVAGSGSRVKFAR